jgi:hypothetical protein
MYVHSTYNLKNIASMGMNGDEWTSVDGKGWLDRR